MTNVETRTDPQIVMTAVVVRASGFFRLSDFVIRHFPKTHVPMTLTC
jgi:hypothetical protein